MGGLPSTVTNKSFFRITVPAKISCHVPENMAEAVTRDIDTSGWLKLAALCLFRAQSVPKINTFVTVLGQGRKEIDQHSYLIHSWTLVAIGSSNAHSWNNC